MIRCEIQMIPDKISGFLREKIDNYDQMVEDVVKKYKEEMKVIMQHLQEGLTK